MVTFSLLHFQKSLVCVTSKAEMETRQHLQRTHDENSSESKKSIVVSRFSDLSFENRCFSRNKKAAAAT